MRTSLRHPLLHLGTLVGLLAACGDNSSLPGITPSVTISSPSDNSSVSLGANKQISIGFHTNYTLKAPGGCGGQDTCGHVYVLVDNSSCNTGNLPYNTLAVSSPTLADLSHCATPTGMHTILVELHHDDGTAVKNLLGNPVTDRVTVTAQ